MQDEKYSSDVSSTELNTTTPTTRSRRRQGKEKKTNEEKDPTHDYTSSSIYDINISWLVLSHGSWIAAALFCVSTVFSVISTDFLPFQAAKALALGWCSMSFTLMLWTFQAILKTWPVIANAKHPVFGLDSVAFLIVIIFICTGISIWSLVVIAQL